MESQNESEKQRESKEFIERKKDYHRVSIFDYTYYKDKATSELKRQNFEGALEYFKRALSYNPKCSDYYPFYRLAEIQFKLGKPEEALKNINEALKLNKDFNKLLLIKAEVLYHLGRLELCAEEFDKAFEISNPYYETPLHYKIHYANVLVELNEKEKALDIYNEIIKNNLNKGRDSSDSVFESESVSSNLESFDYNCSHKNSSDNIFRHNYSIQNKQVPSKIEFSVYFNRSEILQKLGRYAEALESLNKAMLFKIDEKELQLRKAKLMAKQKQFFNLETFLKRFIELNVHDVRGYMRKADLRLSHQAETKTNGGKKNVIYTSEFSQVKRMEKELNSFKEEISSKDALIKSLQDAIELRKIDFDKSKKLFLIFIVFNFILFFIL